MINKTIIIDNNGNSLNKLTQYMKLKMPQLNLIGSFDTISEGLAIVRKEKPKLLFVNIQDLDADKFLQLQQMRDAACSIIFITPGLIEENLKNLPQQMVNIETTEKTGFRLKIDNAVHIIPYKQIVRLQAQGNYTLFFLKDRTKPVITSRTLKFYEKKFKTKHFIRTHRSHLVNQNYINSIDIINNKFLMLKDGTTIEISRRKAQELKQLNKYTLLAAE